MLIGMDEFARTSEPFARPGFDLDEDQGVAVAANEIDLAAAVFRFKVVLEDFVTAFSQKFGSQLFAFCAPPNVIGLLLSSKPLPKSGDASQYG